MRGPLLTIVIPVYQVEAYLQECLDSVLHQHFSDWEALCVYDDSADQSLETLNAYAQSDSRIQIIYGREKGLSGARNDGILKARGKYILFMDSDDYYPDGALDRIIEYMEKENPNILVFSAHIVPKTPRAPMFYSNYLTTRNVVYEPFHPDALFRELGAKPFVWRNCFQTEFLRNHGLRFNEDLRVGEDQAFQMEAFPLAGRIVFAKDKLYCYRWLREGSLQFGFDRDSETKLRGHMDIISSVASAWRKNGLLDTMQSEFAAWAIDLIYSEATRLEPDQCESCLSDAAALLRQEIPPDVLGALSAYDMRRLEQITSKKPIQREKYLANLGKKIHHIVHLRGWFRALILVKSILFR